MRPSKLTCAVMTRPRTAALVDGRLTVDRINCTDAMPSTERHPNGHNLFDCTYGPAEGRLLQRYHVVQGLIETHSMPTSLLACWGPSGMVGSFCQWLHRIA